MNGVSSSVHTICSTDPSTNSEFLISECSIMYIPSDSFYFGEKSLVITKKKFVELPQLIFTIFCQLSLIIETKKNSLFTLRETIEALNTEIQNLTKVIEEKTLGAEDTNLNELRKLRDELTSQRDNLKSEVSNLKGDKETMQQEITELKDENGKLETKITNSNLEVQSRTNEMNREIRRKERAEREVKVQNTLEILLVKSIFDEKKLLKTFSSRSDGNSKASDILLLQ